MFKSELISPEIFETIIDSLTEGIVVHDNKGKITQFNQAALLILDLNEDELLGRTSYDPTWKIINEDYSVASPETHPASIALAQKVGHKQKIMGVHTKNNMLKWILVSAVPTIEKATGEVQLVVVTFVDITETKKNSLRLEELTAELKKKDAFLDSVLNKLPTLVSYVDKELRYRYVNETYENWFKSPRDLIIGKNMHEILGKDALIGITPYVMGALNGEPQKFDLEIPYQNAGLRNVEIVYIPDFSSLGQVEGFYVIVIDQTEVVQSRNEIKKSNQSLSLLLDSIPAMIGHWNRDLINLNANLAYSDFFGQSPEEIKGKHIKVLLGQDLFEKSLPFIEGVLRGDPQTFEREIPTASGTKYTLAKYIPEVVDREVVGFFVVATDVTPLKMSEQKFKGVLESAYDAIILIDSNGRIKLANKQALNWFGYKEEELLNRPAEMLIPAGNKSNHVTQWKEFLSHPTPNRAGINLDLQARRKDGTEFPVDVSISQVQTGEGQFISTVIRDISEKKFIELQRMFLVETNDILSATLNYQDRLRRITQILAPKIADWCAVSILENNEFILRALTLFEGTKGTSKTESFEKYGSALKIESLIQGPNSKRLINVPLILKGERIGVITLAMYGSQRSFTKEDLILAELVASKCAVAIENARLFLEVQKIGQAREDVVAVVSHDLKNPLAAISLTLKMIEKMKPEGIAQEAWEKLKNKFDYIRQSTESALNLISSILDLTKLESRTLKLDLSKIDAKALTQDVVRMLLPIADAREIHLRVTLPATELTMMCNEQKIYQALSNLIGNSLKFTPNGGEVCVRVFQENDSIHFAIKDTGQGIAKENLPHIFERFWQSRDTEKLGTGLGLSIVSKIIELHRGKIWVESELGMGSTFHFTLPLGCT